MNRDIQKLIGFKKKQKATKKTIEEAKKIAGRIKKIKGVEDVALAGSISKGVPSYNNINYMVIIDSYSNPKIKEIRKKAGEGNSVILITRKDLEKKSRKTKPNPLIKTMDFITYLGDKMPKAEGKARSILEEKLPKFRAKISDPRLIQTWVPLTEEKVIKEAQEKQKNKGIKNIIFQKSGFRKAVDLFLNNEISKKEFKKLIKEEPKSREYLFRFSQNEKNKKHKQKLEKLIEEMRII